MSYIRGVMIMTIGELIKFRRKELKMTQAELADNLCTQAMISKIESDLLNPSSKTLEKIALKLDVPVSYFYGEYEKLNEEHFKKLEENIRLFLNKGEYESANYLIELNLEEVKKSSTESIQQFFNWVEGVLSYYIKKDTPTAIQIIKKLVNTVSPSHSLYLDILSSLAIIYYETEDYNEADNYFSLALEHMESTSDFQLKARILYNYALNLESLSKDKEAFKITLDTIEMVIQNQSLYLLGYLYYYKGYLLRKKQLYTEALDAYEDAYSIFKITNYRKMLSLVQVEIKEVKDSEKTI